MSQGSSLPPALENDNSVSSQVTVVESGICSCEDVEL